MDRCFRAFCPRILSRSRTPADRPGIAPASAHLVKKPTGVAIPLLAAINRLPFLDAEYGVSAGAWRVARAARKIGQNETRLLSADGNQLFPCSIPKATIATSIYSRQTMRGNSLPPENRLLTGATLFAGLITAFTESILPRSAPAMCGRP